MEHKYEAYIDGTGAWRIGISLGTVYSLDYNKIISLYNFGYCIKTGEFYFNNNIHLSPKLIKYFDEKMLSDELKYQLSELGIYDREMCTKELDEYKKTLEQTSEARQKVFQKMGKKFE